VNKIWAPWRAPYILKQVKTKRRGCIFCHALKDHKRKKRSPIIEVTHLSFSILNLFPYNNGHLMVMPKRHVGDFLKIKPEELTDMMLLLQKSQKALTRTLKPHGFNVGLNLGREAGAGIVNHLHFHIVPRWKGDTNFFPLFSDTKVISESLAAVQARLLTDKAKRKKGVRY